MMIILMEPKFTPGPWAYELTTERIFAPRRDLICWMKPSSTNPNKAAHNGNLISAAPEMYEALVLCRDYILTSDDNFAEQSTAFIRATAALAKADGRS